MTNSLGPGSVEIPYGKGVFWCCNDIIIMASLLTSSEVAEEKLQVYIIKTFFCQEPNTPEPRYNVAALIFITWSLS